jgi:hypothetical protein
MDLEVVMMTVMVEEAVVMVVVVEGVKVEAAGAATVVEVA